MQDEATTRDRLLRATAELLDEPGGTASTRAICERAGVTAPTLYHHFGSKQALVDAVINYGVTQYLSGPDGDVDDPVAAIRDGWDAHVRYGLENPSFYVLLHGRIRVGVPCGVTGPAQETLGRLLSAAAGRGLLRVPVVDASARILAANVGVTLSLIGQLEDARDPELSHGVREAVLSSVLAAPAGDSPTAPAGDSPIGLAGDSPTGPAGDRPTRLAGGPPIGLAGDSPIGPAGDKPTRQNTAITLRAVLDHDSSGLTAGEAALLTELLDRLSRAPATA